MWPSFVGPEWFSGVRFQACEPITGMRVVSHGCWGVVVADALKGRDMRVFLTRLLLAAAGMVMADTL